ncbi:MAG: serine protease, partial [bacterium]|nr:serine protease [bacterium]
VLRSSLREDSPAPTHSSCYAQKMYLTEDPSDMILASGNCVFISPDLVLSNYHVLGKRDLYYTDESAIAIHTFIRTDDGFQSFVSHPVALSPLYDLALVQLEEKNPNFQGLGISQALEEKYMKYSYSYTHPVDPEKRLGSLSVTSGNLDYLSSTQNYGYTQEGSHSYPSFYVTPALERGYSGSPVFQNGKLIGLVASVSFENGHTIITPHVKNFLEDILEEKEE